MFVEVVVGTLPIRVVTAYGAQENALKEKKEKFENLLKKK